MDYVHTYIAEAAVRRYGCKVADACCSDNPRTRWWTPGVKGAIKLKNENESY